MDGLTELKSTKIITSIKCIITLSIMKTFKRIRARGKWGEPLYSQSQVTLVKRRKIPMCGELYDEEVWIDSSKLAEQEMIEDWLIISSILGRMVYEKFMGKVFLLVRQPFLKL